MCQPGEYEKQIILVRSQVKQCMTGKKCTHGKIYAIKNKSGRQYIGKLCPGQMKKHRNECVE